MMGECQAVFSFCKKKLKKKHVICKISFLFFYFKAEFIYSKIDLKYGLVEEKKRLK